VRGCIPLLTCLGAVSDLVGDHSLYNPSALSPQLQEKMYEDYAFHLVVLYLISFVDEKNK
jgi:hypothetical protein